MSEIMQGILIGCLPFAVMAIPLFIKDLLTVLDFPAK